MVFYRSYRPQILDDLIGQDLVKQALFNAFKNQKLAHAYLFCGPRGTGKTSTARILAKIVNCSDKENPGCGKCESCNSISDGSSLDLIEIDAASNRGIEDIRSLRENIKLAPSRSLKKVYIIDEVHMLTTEAFNALLKTLEEPPSHVLFILATTDPQKVPATILSRVTKLEFKLASSEDLKKAFTKILESEKIEFDQEALDLLSKAAHGSFRDGVKLLDQVASSGSVRKTDVEKVLSVTSQEKIIKLLESICASDPKSALMIFSELMENGASVKELNINLLQTIKDLSLIKYGLPNDLMGSKYESEEFKKLNELSGKFSTQKLNKIMDSLAKSLERSRYILIPTLPLEIALIESCQKDIEKQSAPVVEVIQSITSPNILIPSSNIDQESAEISDSVNISSEPNINDDIAKIQDKWTYILETTRAYNYSMEALLRSSRIKDCSGKIVTIEVPYSFHQRMLEAPKSRDLLESVLSDILGRSVNVATVLGQRPQRKEDIQNVELAPDDEIVRLAAEIFSS